MMTAAVRSLAIITLLLCALVPRTSLAQSHGVPELPSFETRYYVVYTDVAPDDAREAAARMTVMAEEYARRTRDFSGAIRTKFPFYLVRRQDDYMALGGIEGSAGLFDGRWLVVHVPGRCDARTWHVLQHEGFHQFAAAVIGGDRPAWVNEGLAEYFGEALFTGDGYVCGVVPPWRLARVRQEIAEHQFRSLASMMHLSIEEWNANLSVVNYDEGWAMVHFLAHGDDGKYRRAFGQFMSDLGRHVPWPKAWAENFGTGPGFEDRWRTYWTSLPDHPTADLCAKATVATLTSFLARATAQRQTFDSFDELVAAAKAGRVSVPVDQWLPRKLLDDAVADAEDLRKEGGAEWSLSPVATKKLPQVTCRLADGTRIVGRFALRNGRAEDVTADVVKK
jgi:hypothetical protein